MCKPPTTTIIKSISAIFLLVMLLSCGGDNGGPTGIAVEIVPMTGSLDFADPGDVDLDNITIVLGESSSIPDQDGEFSIGGNKLVPGLATAYDHTDSTLMLLAIVPHPIAGGQIELDIHSTAIALVYIHPLITVGGDYHECLEVMSRIDSLPEFTTLENILQTQLAANPKALGTENSAIANAIFDVVGAYINSYPDYLKKKFESSLIPQKPTYTAEDAGGVAIIPTTQVSGHLLKYLGKDKFMITNAYGRWALMHIPRDSKKAYLSPNGSMMDFIKDGRPWAPSEYTFDMPVSATEDTVLVNVYGYGFSNFGTNNFNQLTQDEALMVHNAGCLTVILELLNNLVSVMTNTVNNLEAVDGWEKTFPDKSEMYLLELLISDAPFIANVELLYSQEQYYDMLWLIFKKCFEIVSSNEFLSKLAAKIAGKALNDKQISVIEALRLSPAFRAAVAGVTIGNKVTNVMKTVYGFGDAQLKTTFKVHRENGEFGDISGYVMEKDSPFGPIEDARVVLGGDDANPLPGHATQWNTDSDGGFLFADCLTGSKTVTASKAGYKSETVDVIVLDNQETRITIELERNKGTVAGLIVNDIKSKWRAHPQGNPSQDTLFRRETNLRIYGMVGDEEYDVSWSLTSGTINKEIPVGTFWVVVSSSYYKSDSLQVTILEDQTVNLSRPLRMHPDSYMKAENTYISEYAGSPFDIDFSEFACTPPITDWSGTGMIFLARILGSTYHEFYMLINLAKLNETGFYDIGHIYSDFPNQKWVRTDYRTSAILCDDGDSVSFGAFGIPGMSECDCDIEYPGNVIFTQFSTELGAPIEGAISAKLAGWKNCDCDSVDTNGDHILDAVEVDCRVVDLDIKFQTVVGDNFWLLQGFYGDNPFDKAMPIFSRPEKPIFSN